MAVSCFKKQNPYLRRLRQNNLCNLSIPRIAAIMKPPAFIQKKTPARLRAGAIFYFSEIFCKKSFVRSFSG